MEEKYYYQNFRHLKEILRTEVVRIEEGVYVIVQIRKEGDDLFLYSEKVGKNGESVKISLYINESRMKSSILRSVRRWGVPAGFSGRYTVRINDVKALEFTIKT